MMIAIFFIADRILKQRANNLFNTENYSLIKNLFSFSLTKNYNIAFSLPLSGPWLNILISIIILTLLFIIIQSIYKQKQIPRETLVLIFILFGAISNIIDRFQYGYVIDYLELKYFTAFNLADVMISLGALLLILQNINFLAICSKTKLKTQ